METAMRVLLVEDDEKEVHRFQACFNKEADVKLIATTAGSTEALSLVQKMVPDVVLLDLELEEGDGIEFLYELEELSLPRRPFILVITWTTVRSVLQNAIDHGVGHIQPKSDAKYESEGPELVLRYLRRMRPYFRFDDKPELTPVEPEDAPLHLEDEAAEAVYWKSEISAALGQIGITSGSMSHEYLTESIFHAARQPRLLIDMTNDIYPALEKLFNKDRRAIEISMRRCIETTWKKADVMALRKYYKQAYSPEKGKPELHEFISYYANQIRVRMACSR